MKIKTNKESLLGDLNRTVSVYTIGRLIEGKPMDQSWRNDMLHDMLSLMIYYQLVRRFDTICENTLVDKIVKTITIVTIGKWMNDTASEIPKVLFYSIIGTIIYYLMIQKYIVQTIKTSVPAFIDPSCIDDWIEDIVLTSLDDRPGDIVSSIVSKIAAIGVYYHFIKPNI